MPARFSLVLLAASALLTVAAEAKPVIHHCNLDAGRRPNRVAEEIYISHEVARGEVIVFDPILQHFTGKPAVGRIAVDNAVRVTFAWELPKITSRGQFVTALRYRATIQKNGQAISVSATPLGYSNTFEARGRCKFETGKLPLGG